MSFSRRTVVYVSDGTGVTAETFGHAMLAQFNLAVTEVKIPFVDTEEKAHAACRKIRQLKEQSGHRPLVFVTLVQDDLRAILATAEGFVTDLIGSFVKPLEAELGMKSSHTVGKHYANAEYKNRIAAINYTMQNDDGQNINHLAEADLILVGVSRCGKTPTSLYLAIQYGKKIANYPLLPEDLEGSHLPTPLQPHRDKIFGLSIAPLRLTEVRNERRPGSKYAALENCMREVSNAERLMTREGIPWVDSTARSIEEIAARILDDPRFA